MRLLKLLLLSGVVISTSFGQTAVGRIVGVISDGSGSVLRGARVSATDQKTGLHHTVTTDDKGEYTVTQLQTSLYSILFTMTGFAEADVKDIPLQVGQEVTRNITLQPAGVSTAV